MVIKSTVCSRVVVDALSIKGTYYLYKDPNKDNKDNAEDIYNTHVI